MHYKKIFWWARAQLFRIVFKKVGIKSYLGKPCFIEGGRRVEIGNKVRIFPGLRLEAIGKEGKVVIGDNCALEQNVHITSMGSSLLIGKDTTISAGVCITNLDHEYKDVQKSVMEQPYICKTTEIGEGCFIGFGASIQAGTVLGKHCVVGTRAVVRGSFPDYTVIVGCPARAIKRYNPETEEWEKI
jgi:acetyltransferase-like isoleucine patch superfamily enzyme